MGILNHNVVRDYSKVYAPLVVVAGRIAGFRGPTPEVRVDPVVQAVILTLIQAARKAERKARVRGSGDNRNINDP